MNIPLLENGSDIVDAAFLSLSNPSPPTNAEVSNSDAGIVATIDAIAGQFIKLIDQDIKDRPATDAQMAEFLHRGLKLPLYQASQHRFWHYIAVTKCPQYVAWRWFNENMNSVPKRQYVGPWYRNALGRLWWWAEYTQDGAAGVEQYSRTIRAGRSQEFMRNIIENSLCGNRSLVRSLCDAAFPASGIQMKDEQHRDLVRLVNAMLVTTALDALRPSEIDGVVKSLVKELNISAEPKTKRKTPARNGFLTRLVRRR